MWVKPGWIRVSKIRMMKGLTATKWWVAIELIELLGQINIGQNQVHSIVALSRSQMLTMGLGSRLQTSPKPEVSWGLGWSESTRPPSGIEGSTLWSYSAFHCLLRLQLRLQIEDPKSFSRLEFQSFSCPGPSNPSIGWRETMQDPPTFRARIPVSFQFFLKPSHLLVILPIFDGSSRIVHSLLDKSKFLMVKFHNFWGSTPIFFLLHFPQFQVIQSPWPRLNQYREDAGSGRPCSCAMVTWRDSQRIWSTSRPMWIPSCIALQARARHAFFLG